MVSSIEQKKAVKQEKKSGKTKSNYGAFFGTLLLWILGIVLTVIVYIGFGTAYFKYNTAEYLPSNPNKLPYSDGSIAGKARNMLKKYGFGKHIDAFEKGVNTLHKFKDNMNSKVLHKQNDTIKHKSSNEIGYFYKQGGNYLSDWIAQVLIYSWSSLRENISVLLPEPREKTINNEHYSNRVLFFIFSPVVLGIGAIGTMISGMLKTLWGVFARNDSIIDFIISFSLTIFPFPILAPVFFVLAMVVSILQPLWFIYTFAIEGFRNSAKGSFGKVAKEYANVIMLLFASGLVMSTLNLAPGILSKGLTIGGIVLVIISLMDIGRKMYNKTK